MIFTTRFKVLVGLLVLLVVLIGLGYNQYQIQKTLDRQSAFDKQVIDRDVKIWDALQKSATQEATVKEVRPTVTPKATLSAK